MTTDSQDTLRHCYEVHGVELCSELALPASCRALRHAQLRGPPVQVRMVQASRHGRSFYNDEDLFIAEAGRVSFHVPEVANYHIFAGQQIDIDPLSGARTSDLQLYLLGSAMGALLHQLGRLALHASAIDTRHGAVLFCGLSQAGKSTTAATFARTGFRTISDDISAIEFDRDRAFVRPGPAQSKLWADALDLLGESPHGLERTRPNMAKFNVVRAQQHVVHRRPIHRIYLLEPTDDAPTALSPIRGFAKFQGLAQHTYRGIFLRGLGLQRQHLEAVRRIATTIPILRVRWPKPRTSLATLRELLERDFCTPSCVGEN